MSEFFSDEHAQAIPFKEITKDEQELLSLYQRLSKADKERFLFYTRGFAQKPPYNK